MKTYKNEKYGFEINIPEDWSLYDGHDPFWSKIPFWLVMGWMPKVDVAFTCGPNEILNFAIEPMSPAPSPAFTQQIFILQSQKMGYTNWEFSRIIVEGVSHTAVRYQMFGKIWSKKYLIVLNEVGYAVTASCNDRALFEEREVVWDAIVTSFRLIP